jgi:hypothetical protein
VNRKRFAKAPQFVPNLLREASPTIKALPTEAIAEFMNTIENKQFVNKEFAYPNARADR